MDAVKDYMLTNKGLTISRNFLEDAGLGDEIDIVTKDHTIVIRPKSMTDKVRGIVKGSTLTVENLDDLYHFSKGV
jgi:hypothetical protein